MMSNPHLIKFTKDDLADMMIRKWFGKGNADTRKSMLKEEVEYKARQKSKLTKAETQQLIEKLTKQMKEAAKLLEFEHAAYLRDQIKKLKGVK